MKKLLVLVVLLISSLGFSQEIKYEAGVSYTTSGLNGFSISLSDFEFKEVTPYVKVGTTLGINLNEIHINDEEIKLKKGSISIGYGVKIEKFKMGANIGMGFVKILNSSNDYNGTNDTEPFIGGELGYQVTKFLTLNVGYDNFNKTSLGLGINF